MGADQDALERGTNRFASAIVARMPFGVVVFELSAGDDLRLVAANLAASRLFGRDLGAAAGANAFDVFPHLRGTDRFRMYREAAVTGKPVSIGDIKIPSEDGAHRRYDVHAIPLGDRCVAVLFDELSRERADAADAQRLHAFLDSIVENIPAMVFVKDAEQLRFELFNRAGEQLLGMDRKDLIGKNDYDFFPKEQADFFQSIDRKVLEDKSLRDVPGEPIQTATGERWLHTKKIPILDDQGRAKHLLGISLDITERRQAKEELERAHQELEERVRERTAALVRANEELTQQIAERRKTEEALLQTEEQLRQSQKMEAVGRLAGGIAHDFNNLLSVVLSYSDMIIAELREVDPLRNDLREIKKAGERASELTRQLLAFSRQQVLTPTIVQLNDVVAQMERMLHRLIGEDISLETHTSADLGTVKVDRGQIELVLMNLAVNARDAMPKGGKLVIETANVELDEAYARTHFGVVPGPHVLLAMSDTGIGMDKQTISRIFEPFFTTKSKDKGTGLGLSTVFGIVKQSGGSIWVYSEPGKGSTFKIYLPIATGPLDAVPAPAAPVPMGKRTETILIVEDEEQVRKVTKGILLKCGYDVLEARDGAEAMKLFEEHGERIELLVTDLIMPRMSGHELAARLKEIRSDLRVLYVSGYTDNTITHYGVVPGGFAFLQKPITPDALAKKVREVLDARITQRPKPA